MSSLEDEKLVYSLYILHPLIAHHAKRAHVYKVCCGPIETPEMFSQYLANFNLDSNQYYVMNKFLSNWFVSTSFSQVHAIESFFFFFPVLNNKLQ